MYACMALCGVSNKVGTVLTQVENHLENTCQLQVRSCCFGWCGCSFQVSLYLIIISMTDFSYVDTNIAVSEDDTQLAAIHST